MGQIRYNLIRLACRFIITARALLKQPADSFPNAERQLSESVIPGIGTVE